MKSNEILKVNLQRLGEVPEGQTTYKDENVIVLDELNVPVPPDQLFQTDCFMLVFCMKGEMTASINNKTHTIKAEQCAILLPGSLIRSLGERTERAVKIIAFSSDFLKETVSIKKELWDIANHLYSNPIYPINRNKSYKMYLYRELFINYIPDTSHPFHREILKHIFAGAFFEMLSELNAHLPEGKKLDYNLNRAHYIFRKFMELVTMDDGRHRSVAYYADQLCYSAKHISTVVKQVSGKAPLKIINDHAIERIKYQLKYTDMSMKEVADYFEFSNPSFFGKFVKQHLGMSPQQYRNSKEA